MPTGEQLKEWGKQGGKKRALQFTSESQKMARSCVKRSSLQESGRRGYQALVKSKGKDYAVQFLTKWRLEHPSNLEKIVAGWLDETGICYQREVEIGGWHVDFLIGDSQVIECDGELWHTNNSVHGEDREGRDADKDTWLRQHGYRLLRLPEQDILIGSGKSELLAFLILGKMQ